MLENKWYNRSIINLFIYKNFMKNFPEQAPGGKEFSPNQAEAISRKEILADLERTGLKEQLDEQVIDRLCLLDRGSKFQADARPIERGVVNVLDFLEKHQTKQQPSPSFTPEQKTNLRVAAILNDIGKSGLMEATMEQQEAVIKLFAVEGVTNGEKRSVREVVNKNFVKGEADGLLENLAACSVDPSMTMREFWDRHAAWTHDILEKYPAGLNRHIRIIAASHHLDRGINPYGLSEPVADQRPGIIKTAGDEADDFSVRVLMVVDKYQATIRRSGFRHKEAIDWVRHNLAQFKDDDLLKQVIDAVDELGKQEKIFI